MTELEKHRKTWQGKTDEWLFNRLANELKDKVEEIHKLLAENEQLILSGVISCFYCKEDLKSDEIEVNSRVEYEEKTCRKCFSKHNL